MTPTVSMLSPARWLLPPALDIPDFSTSHVGCRHLRLFVSVAVWPPCGPSRFANNAPNRNHDDSQPLASAVRSPRPSTVLEMFGWDVATSRTDLGLSAAEVEACRARDRVPALPKVAEVRDQRRERLAAGPNAYDH